LDEAFLRVAEFAAAQAGSSEPPKPIQTLRTVPSQLHSADGKGQVSLIESSTLANAAAAISMNMPAGGSARADLECAPAVMRIGAVLHPAVLLAFANGAGLAEHRNRQAASRRLVE